MSNCSSLTCVAIEGHDKSGKSTLAKALCQEMQAKYIHYGPPEKGSKVKDQYLRPFRNQNQPMVIDRWGLGELIYGPMLRGRSSLSQFELKVLLRIFNTINSVFVMSVLPLDLLEKRFDTDELVTKEQTIKAREQFSQWVNFMDHHCSNLLVHSAVTPEDTNKTVKRVLSRLDETRKNHIYLGPTYGNINGQYLIVGEAVNEKRTWLHYPFTHGKASEFLAQSLEAGDILERDCYFMNADCLWFDSIADKFKDKTIITLGQVATRRCLEGGFACTDLPHPQYWLRFQYKELIKYHDFFKQIRKEAENACV